LGNPFRYTAAEVANVEAALSIDRFSSYVVAAGGDRGFALELYEWNSSVSAAFYVPLQSIEIGLRNACHRELAVLFGAAWPDDRRFQQLGFLAAIDEAKERLRRLNRPRDTPHIVAELSFGFWTTILGRRFEHTLWNPALRRAFPRFASIVSRNPGRPEIAKRFDHIRVFRSRIAHHEPIFTRALAHDYRSLLEVASWMHADLAEWTSRVSSSCQALVEAGPPTRRTVLVLPRGWCGKLLA
jgi:hypothetical protein